LVVATSTSDPCDAGVPTLLLLLLPLPDDNELPPLLLPQAASARAAAMPAAVMNSRLDGLVNVGFPT
jgi:hypothetical protein